MFFLRGRVLACFAPLARRSPAYSTNITATLPSRAFAKRRSNTTRDTGGGLRGFQTNFDVVGAVSALFADPDDALDFVDLNVNRSVQQWPQFCEGCQPAFGLVPIFDIGAFIEKGDVDQFVCRGVLEKNVEAFLFRRHCGVGETAGYYFDSLTVMLRLEFVRVDGYRVTLFRRIHRGGFGAMMLSHCSLSRFDDCAAAVRNAKAAP
jgi:hypothetical protein